MKVRMLTGLAGVHYSVSPGDLHDVDAAEAKRLIDAGIAEPVKTVAKKIETTEAKVPAKESRIKAAAKKAGQALKSLAASD